VRLAIQIFPLVPSKAANYISLQYVVPPAGINAPNTGFLYLAVMDGMRTTWPYSHATWQAAVCRLPRDADMRAGVHCVVTRGHIETSGGVGSWVGVVGNQFDAQGGGAAMHSTDSGPAASPRITKGCMLYTSCIKAIGLAIPVEMGMGDVIELVLDLSAGGGSLTVYVDRRRVGCALATPGWRGRCGGLSMSATVRPFFVFD
jgi:hypothetical protein